MNWTIFAFAAVPGLSMAVGIIIVGETVRWARRRQRRAAR